MYRLTSSDSLAFGSGIAPAVGDFDGDGFPDVAGVNSTTNMVTIYLGHGDGTFTAGTSIGISAVAGPIVVGDFNEDGNLDLAVGGSSGVVNILLGRGDGTFVAGANPSVGSGGSSLVVADFNGDGHADLAQANETSNNLSILLGNGDGTFTATATNPATSANPRMVAVGDFNGDGKPDLVTSTGRAGGTMTLLLGNGDGTFTAGTTPPAGGSPVSVAVGDFDGNGKLDLAVGDNSSDSVEILRGNGDGTFTVLPALLPAGSIPADMLVGDFDGDGRADIAVANDVDRTVTVLLGAGDGTFSAGATTPAYPGGGLLLHLSAGDFNGDGTVDLVAGGAGTAPLDVMLSTLTDSAVASLPLVSPVGTGVHLIVASYPGNGLYGPTTSDALGVTASPVNTTLTLGASPSTALAGQQVVLTATLAPYSAQNHTTDGELVTFKNGTASVGTGTLHNGVATLNLTSLPAGSDQITATFAVDTNFTTSTSTTTSYPVLNGTTLTFTTTPSTITYLSTVTMTATLSPYTAAGKTTDGEQITFSSGNYTIAAALSGGVATFNKPTSLPAGTLTWTATYPGDSYFAAATSNPVVYTVNKATPSVTWTPAASATYTGRSFSTLLNASSTTPGTISDTVTPSGGSPVPLLATTVLGAGSYTLTATLTPTDATDYTTATASVPFTVAPATLTLVPVNATRAYGATNPALTGSVTGGLNGDQFTVTGATTATAVSPVGSYSITYTVTGANLANYTYAPQTATLTVSRLLQP